MVGSRLSSWTLNERVQPPLLGGSWTGGVAVNTIFGWNSPSNCTGRITDAGHNLSSDASCLFGAPSSRNSVDPGLGALSDNGGPTLTIPLLPGSPAIDAGDPVAAPLTDQRGFPRPAGAGPDIGAFEYGSLIPTLSITAPPLTQTAEAGTTVRFRVVA